MPINCKTDFYFIFTMVCLKILKKEIWCNKAINLAIKSESTIGGWPTTSFKTGLCNAIIFRKKVGEKYNKKWFFGCFWGPNSKKILKIVQFWEFFRKCRKLLSHMVKFDV